MAYKMKGPSLYKKQVGPRAKKKKVKKTIDFENPKDREKIYNKTEVKRK
tara:strand:+ start:351 stop:497 length:147 start_codon:yes stop_codon:yes gene_type:complete